MRRRLVLSVIVLFFGVSPALALTDEEIFRDLRFNLINPGARAMAMGGAFISLADDATAAQTNPAGLAILEDSEYFAELRVVDNRAEASRINETLPAGINTFVATGTDTDDVISPTFLSSVTVYGNWAMGLSLQEVLNIDSSSLSSFAFTFPESSGAFLAEGTGSVDMTVRNLNFSVGVRLKDHWRVGATMTLSRLNVDAEVENKIVDTDANIAPEEILEELVDLRTSIDDDDDEVVYSAGVIYRRPHWGAGAVYRRGPRFSVVESIDPEQEPIGDGLPEGIDLFGVRQRLGTRFLNRFALPDSYGIGGHWSHFDDTLTLSASVERIDYSNLLDRYVPGVNVLTSPDAEFDVDDGTDTRIGAEYFLLNEERRLPPIAVRAGMFWESDTTITAKFTGAQGFASEEAFQGRDDEFHWTAGAGINAGRHKIDFAGDFADTDNEYLVSFIYKVKKP